MYVEIQRCRCAAAVSQLQTHLAIEGTKGHGNCFHSEHVFRVEFKISGFCQVIEMSCALGC